MRVASGIDQESDFLRRRSKLNIHAVGVIVVDAAQRVLVDALELLAGSLRQLASMPAPRSIVAECMLLKRVLRGYWRCWLNEKEIQRES